MPLMPIAVIAFAFVGTAVDSPIVQTDWSGGRGVGGPVATWNNRFDSSMGISWRSIPGQIALSSAPLGAAVKHPLGAGQTVAGGIHAADVDGDGDADVISTQYQALEWWERLNDGTWLSHPIVANFWGMASSYVVDVDLDKDGDDDIVVTTYYGPPNDQTNGRVTFFENLNGVGTSWATHVIEQEFYGVNRVAVGDIDGDGDLDLVSDSYLAYSIPGTDDVIWLENTDGIGHTWTHHLIDTNYMNALSVDLADVDGDGDLDIVGTTAGLPQANPNNIVWWENSANGAGSWTRRVIQASYSYAVGARAVDMDGDGDLDVVAASYDFNQIAWFENAAPLTSSSWAKHLISSSFMHPIDIRVADLDGDGDRDVFATTTFVGTDLISWWQNTAGTGLSWTQKAVATNLDYPTIDSGDVNQDGKLEIIATEQGTSAGLGKLWWWDVTQFNPSGALTSSILDGGDDGGASAWDSIGFDAGSPPSTSLTLEVRASDVPGNLGSWQAVPSPSASLAGLIDPAARYLQYRFTLATSDPASSPIARQVSVSRSPVAPPCEPDIDHSGGIDVDDLFEVINAWGPCAECPADVTGDGVVDVDDLFAVINAWGSCG